MPIELPDLWGDDIQVGVLPPLVILKAQDEAIKRKTQGILRTEVSTTEPQTNPDNEEVSLHFTIHSLDLVASALDYRESLLEVSHKPERAYPAMLQVPDPIRWDLASDPPPVRGPVGVDLDNMLKASREVTAYSSEELITYLRRALRSRNTKAAIDSLLARSNEARIKHGVPPASDA